MFKNKLNYKLINILLLMAIILILYMTADKWGIFLSKIISVIFPFLIAFGFAYVLHPFVKWLESKGIRKKIAIFLIVFLIFLLIVGIVWMTLPLVYDQLVLLTKSIIIFLSDISNKFDVNLGDFSNTVIETLNDLVRNLGTYISDGTVDILNKGINILTNTIIIFIVGIYFLSDMDNIRIKVKKFLKGIGKKEYNYVAKLDNEIGNYFHGLTIFMLVQLIEYSVLFGIIGHPNWLLLGVLACITTVIPYFGGYITNIIAIITASVISTPLFIATIIICLIFPNIDGYVISPKIYGKTNNINPVVVIFSTALFGGLFGFIGIVIALPLYILIKTTYEYYEKDIKRKIINVKETIDE